MQIPCVARAGNWTRPTREFFVGTRELIEPVANPRDAGLFAERVLPVLQVRRDRAPGLHVLHDLPDVGRRDAACAAAVDRHRHVAPGARSDRAAGACCHDRACSPLAPHPRADADDRDRPDQHRDQPQQPEGVVLPEHREDRLADQFAEQEEEHAKCEAADAEDLAEGFEKVGGPWGILETAAISSEAFLDTGNR